MKIVPIFGNFCFLFPEGVLAKCKPLASKMCPLELFGE